MANERTFLAWLRTSLSFITIGIGVTQLFRLDDEHSKKFSILTSANIQKLGKPLGSVFVVLGIITLVFGTNRYFEVQALLVNNSYPATRFAVIFLVSVISVIVASTFVVVLKTSV